LIVSLRSIHNVEGQDVLVKTFLRDADLWIWAQSLTFNAQTELGPTPMMRSDPHVELKVAVRIDVEN